jgi:TatD DNase family protein
MFDTHAHLTLDKYYPDIDDVIKSARDNGLTGMINVFLLPGNQEKLGLLDRYGFMFGAVGIHPEEISAEFNTGEELARLTKLVEHKHPKLVAIGEIGFDYHYLVKHELQTQAEYKQQQHDLFIRQLAIAKKYNLPVIIHCRDAWHDMLPVLEKEQPGTGGVLHCFSGDVDIMNKCIEMGFYISIAGQVTYPNAKNLVQIAEQVPLNRLLVETDAPFLAPQQVRGKRNEPQYLRYTIDKIAQIRNIDINILTEQLSFNTKTCFKIDI